jgi:hypothetical protein
VIARGATIGVIAAALLACGSKRTTTTAPGPHDAGDAGTALALDAAATVDAAAPIAGTAPGYRVIDVSHGGTVAITVTWPTAPAALRRSPGRTACGGERAPRVRIATLHGVADALVVLDLDAGKAPPIAAPVRVSVRDCAVTPPMQVAPGLGAALEIQSADLTAMTVVATGPRARRGPTPRRRWRWRARTCRCSATRSRCRSTHRASIAVALDGALDDAAVVIAPPHPYVAATDEVGVARFDSVPAGTYPVRAWLPARGGHPAVAATGSITVAADSDAALTLVLAP